MEALLVSMGLVALAEIGDKTQLLAIVLATTFRKPWPIIAGILCATILNHLAAATLGYFLSGLFSGMWFKLATGVGFLLMAGWALIPDKADDNAASRSVGGVFLTTLVTFFLVEIGDKTQIATSLLAARFHNIFVVAAGTTLGMMIADTPAVLFGEAATKIIPLRYVRCGSAAVLAVFGVLAIVSALNG